MELATTEDLIKYFKDTSNYKDRSYRVLNHKKDIHIYQDSFLNKDDADTYVDDLIDKYRGSEYTIRECKVIYLVGRWLGAVSFERAQGELFE